MRFRILFFYSFFALFLPPSLSPALFAPRSPPRIAHRASQQRQDSAQATGTGDGMQPPFVPESRHMQWGQRVRGRCHGFCRCLPRRFPLQQDVEMLRSDDMSLSRKLISNCPARSRSDQRVCSKGQSSVLLLPEPQHSFCMSAYRWPNSAHISLAGHPCRISYPAVYFPVLARRKGQRVKQHGADLVWTGPCAPLPPHQEATASV